MSALEQMPAETILAAQEAVTAAGPGARTTAEALIALLGSGLTLPWAPWADGDIVTEEPMRAAASPRHREVALLAGATAHEFNMAWIPADWITADMAAEGLAKAGVPAPLAAVYLDQAGPRPGGAVGQAVTDRTFRVPAQQLAAAKAEAGGPAYSLRLPLGSAGPGRWPAWPSTASTSRSSSTRSANRAWRRRPARLRPERWPRTCTAPWSASSPTAPRAGSRTERAGRPVMVFAEPSGVQDDPLQLERTALT